MAKKITITCDRCGKLINCGDDRILDDIQREYPGKDFCPACFEFIDLAGEVAKRAVAQGKTPKQVAQEWLDRYK